MYKVYSGKLLYWHYRLQLSFVYKAVSNISFKFFCQEDKRLLQEFHWKWGWFQKYNERFPKYLGSKLKFQKTETQFCRWKSNDNNDVNIFLSLEKLYTFSLAKKKAWKKNTLLTLTLNYPKILRKTNYAIQNNSKLAI